MRFRVQGLDHVALSVADQDASEGFYREVLGLERRFEDEWGGIPAAMMAENSGVALFPASGGSPAGLRHVAFRVDRENFELARTELAARGIPFEFQDHDVAHSIYFLDPDGLQLELTTYEVEE